MTERVREARTVLRLLRSGLVDAAFYAGRYADVPPRRWACAQHYVRHGAREGRDPNRFFETSWYVARNQDVLASGMNPLEHYLLAGADEGRDPGPSFVTSRYSARHRLPAGTNPLAHFLASGERAELPAGAPAPGARAATSPSAPTPEEWAQVDPPPGGEGSVVVVVPVYKGLPETLRCLFSVLASRCATPFRLLVVDDASPEDGMREALEELRDRGLLELLVNEENRGFVASVNRGMACSAPADVVLLNSDTQVFGDWLDRLAAPFLVDDRLGTATPLSDNGQLASYPLPLVDNGGALELGPAELDALAAEQLAGEVVLVPTCVGFCTYVRRACLDDVGYFDEEAFGRGYGEENDFSLRATAGGWRHALVGDVFVHHEGGRSFQADSAPLQRRNLAVLQQRYPGYGALVGSALAAEPLKRLRRRLDAARLDRARDGRPTVLLVSHALGGGTRRHVEDLARRLDASGVLPLVLEPAAAGAEVSVSCVATARTPNLRFPVDSGWAELLELLESLGVEHVHLHHLQGYGPSAPALVTRLVDELAVPYDVTVHDWMSLCPRVDMVDDSERYCGGPAPDTCRSCIDRNGSPFGRPDPVEWQADHLAVLARARQVFAPSSDVQDRLLRTAPSLPVVLRPHPELEGGRPGSRPTPAARDDGVVRIALVGALGPNKGSRVLLALAQDAQARGLPLSFHVIGFTDVDSALRRTGRVHVTGRFEPTELPALVHEADARVALLPSVTPETFSYALSEVWDLGLHPVVFDLGALASRVREEGHGTVLPWGSVSRPSDVNDVLLTTHASPAHSRRYADYPDLLRDYYGLALPRRAST